MPVAPRRLKGLIAAPHTPFTQAGELNLPVVSRQLDLLKEGGVSAAFVCGTTGEGQSLSTPERMHLAEAWVRAAAGSFPVVVHVGHTSLPEAIELARHAGQIKASAFAALAPFFFKPGRVEELVEFCVPIAAAAPEQPFYFYHLPSMTNVNLSMVEFMHRAIDRIPNFAGLKFTHNDLMEFRQCLQIAGDRLDVLFGRDEILLSGLGFGCTGAIGSTYNYAAPVYRRMMDAYGCGDMTQAARCQDHTHQLVEVLRKYGEIGAAKAILRMLGVDCGPVRVPLRNLTVEQEREIYGALRELPLFSRELSFGMVASATM